MKTGSLYKICPVKRKDFEDIRKLRNAQTRFLRQNKKINKLEQKNYSNKYFNKKNKETILFTILFNNKFIGYGGLVHIQKKKSAEISFLTIKKRNYIKSFLEKDFIYFHKFIIKFAEKINIKKLTAEVFFNRPFHFILFKKMNFKIKEKKLRVKKVNKRYYSSLIFEKKI